MKLTYDPFPLIFAEGDDAIKLACVQFFGLGNSPGANQCLVNLIKQQRFDGTFPSGFDPGEWGMQETVRYTLLLQKARLPPNGVNVDSAVHFILDHQNPDGGWCENRALQLPRDRTWLSNERSITWLTADVVDLLHQVAMGGCDACRVAVDWLRTMQNRQGGWPSLADETGGQRSDPDATAQITFLMGELYGKQDLVYQRGRKLFERHLDECAHDAERGYRIRLRDGGREKPDVYHLTHLLLSWWLDPPRRFQDSYDATDPRVRTLMETLVGIQLEDGGWRPFFAEESSPMYTLLAVKALVLSGVLAREELAAEVRVHTVGPAAQ